MLASVALLLAVVQTSTHLSIEPWTGSDLQVTTADAAKYRLVISGPPKATIHLHASQVAQGWFAAFCTPRLCAPQRLDITLPDSGQTYLQFELIRESTDAPQQSGATIVGDGGAFVIVPTAFRQ
jgi:hypothetical protein